MQKKGEEERTALVLHEKSNGQFGTKLFDGHGIQLVLYVQKGAMLNFLCGEKVC